MGVSWMVLLASLVSAIVILCLITFPLQIAMIVMGAKYKDDCPVENMIPIYLIVAGAAGLFSTCCAGGVRYTSQEDDQQTVNPFSGLIQLFLFAWFIAGNVWIYSNYEPNYTDPSSPDFCNKTLYLFAFWVTNSYYILFGFVLGIMCLIGMGVACASQSEV